MKNARAACCHSQGPCHGGVTRWVRQGLSRGSSQVKIAACLCGVDDSRVAAVDPYLIPFSCGLSFFFVGLNLVVIDMTSNLSER